MEKFKNKNQYFCFTFSYICDYFFIILKNINEDYVNSN